MSNARLIARNKAFKFISGQKTATLATTDDNGKPDAAPVHFIIRKNLILYFTSNIDSRKCQNLISNPLISMAITDNNSVSTVQLCGKAEIVEDLSTEQKLLEELWKLRFKDDIWPIPAVQLFESGRVNRLVIIKVTPTEMTYANFTPRKDGRYKSFFQTII